MTHRTTQTLTFIEGRIPKDYPKGTPCRLVDTKEIGDWDRRVMVEAALRQKRVPPESVVAVEIGGLCRVVSEHLVEVVE